MRLGRLLVDGLGTECAKIENDKAIANTQHVDQSPRMASLTRTSSANVEGDERESFRATSQCCWFAAPGLMGQAGMRLSGLAKLKMILNGRCYHEARDNVSTTESLS